MQWMQRIDIDREIDKQMGIRPSSTRPSRPAEGTNIVKIIPKQPRSHESSQIYLTIS